MKEKGNTYPIVGEKTSELFFEVTGWRIVDQISLNQVTAERGYYVGEGLYVHPDCDEFLTESELTEYS